MICSLQVPLAHLSCIQGLLNFALESGILPDTARRAAVRGGGAGCKAVCRQVGDTSPAAQSQADSSKQTKRLGWYGLTVTPPGLALGALPAASQEGLPDVIGEPASLHSNDFTGATPGWERCSREEVTFPREPKCLPGCLHLLCHVGFASRVQGIYEGNASALQASRLNSPGADSSDNAAWGAARLESQGLR